MHYFSPANVMKLLETVRGAKTAPDVVATAISLVARPVRCRSLSAWGRGLSATACSGCVVSRPERMMLEGAMPHEIDAAMVQFGFAMGPLAVSDMGGLDIGFRSRKASGLKAPIADQICEMGRFGQKTGRGYYIYEKGSRTPKRDDGSRTTHHCNIEEDGCDATFPSRRRKSPNASCSR